MVVIAVMVDTSVFEVVVIVLMIRVMVLGIYN
jgi:hypothetical protein